MKCPFCQQELEIVFEQAGHNLEEAYLLCNKCNLRAERKVWQELIRTRKALDYCIKMFKSLENVLDEKSEASDIPDNPDLYAWAVRIKPIWGELKEITGIDYTTEHK